MFLDRGSLGDIAAMTLKLTVTDLACRRGMREVFSGVSFSLREGEGVLLTGPNGSGKTTLLRTLAGFLRPSGGHIHLEGGEADWELPEHCHYIGHLNGVKAAFTVRENLAFWFGFFGQAGDKDGATEAAMARFALAPLADIPAGLLSAGQKRRLGLARLVLVQRPIWLLDEPSVSLDKASVTVLADVVRAHLAEGGLVIAATHVPLGMPLATTVTLGAPEPADSAQDQIGIT